MVVTYTLAVTNNDTACATSSFTRNAAVPTGWTAEFASGPLSINAGATVSTTLSVTPPATAYPEPRGPGRGASPPGSFLAESAGE